jgi:hypothetical protein
MSVKKKWQRSAKIISNDTETGDGEKTVDIALKSTSSGLIIIKTIEYVTRRTQDTYHSSDISVYEYDFLCL